MSPLIANVLVGAVVIIITALSVRSLWKNHKTGGSCNGDCSQCGGCRHK